MGLRRIYATLSSIHLFLGFRQSFSSVYPVSGGMGLRSRSEENLNKLDDCMNDMDEDVAKLFMEYHQTDLREDPELFRLLNEYFTTSKGVSQLCESLRTCLESVVERDEFDCDCDFFARDFLTKTQMCHDDLAKMIVKLERTMKEIDKKLKHVRGKRVIVTAALLTPLIAAIFVSKVIAGIFGSVPLEPITTFGISRWKNSTAALKQEKIAIISMERGTIVALKEIDKISKLVSRLESVEKSVRVALKKRSSAMDKERKTLKSTIVDLDKETERCDGFAEFGRTVAREKIDMSLCKKSVNCILHSNPIRVNHHYMCKKFHSNHKILKFDCLCNRLGATDVVNKKMYQEIRALKLRFLPWVCSNTAIEHGGGLGVAWMKL